MKARLDSPALNIGLSVLPLNSTGITLPPSRLFELQARVHRGVLLLKSNYKTSAWIYEVFDPTFTMQYLRFRAESGEESYFASIFRKIEYRTSFNSRSITSQTFFGFDIESNCTLQSMHYKVMNDLWLHEAKTLFMILIEPRG